MPRFYKFTADKDGRRYTGEWTLLLGGQLRVRCQPYGTMTVTIGADAEPVARAQQVLLQILDAYAAEQDAWKARQDDERARLRGKRDDPDQPVR